MAKVQIWSEPLSVRHYASPISIAAAFQILFILAIIMFPSFLLYAADGESCHQNFVENYFAHC